ncbi:hypothetical protein BTO30_09075 [Domibacillus antri]|uniref:Glycosyl hydrolase n=1 Tax=Domibacillus antri TaxID=1714264 RepID=A0A1Q8Q523_9BACI|nr:hypothetical protein [Domibacillus antri]OLN22456.1 hypothetical protein BTO30_09075 [Domibacillus antri]
MNAFFKTKKSRMMVTAAILLIIAGAAALIAAGRNEEGSSVRFDHIHGLGFTNDGKNVIVPAHDGLRIFNEEGWQKSPHDSHDYMGFSITDNGFYSSGHPSPGSDLKDPMGIVKSDPFGAEIEPLALYGEVDFHGMAAGYHSKAIYLFNPAPNSIMENAGLYFSTDEAATWTQSKAANLMGQASSIAVHPDHAHSVAAGTDQGAFLSTDHGENFKPVLSGAAVSALTFSFNDTLWAGSMDGTASLTMVDLTSFDTATIDIPSLNEGEFITFIAANPKDNQTIAFSTSENNILLSYDAGENWTVIADEGKGIQKVSNRGKRQN